MDYCPCPYHTGRSAMKFVWIPEAPGHPGVYASAMYSEGRETTMNPHAAWNFPTKEACEAWIKEYPSPVFVPVEHGFDA